MADKPFLGLRTAKLPTLSHEDWILLILAHERKRVPNHSAALMNEVFFFLKEFTPAVEGELGFRGTGWGPYSPKVAEAVDKLVSYDFLDIRKDSTLKVNNYSITEKGNTKAKSLLNNIPEKERKNIRFAQFLAHRMGDRGMLQYLSSVHPEYVFIRSAGDAPV